MPENLKNVTSIAHLKGMVDETGQTVTIKAPRRRRRKQGWRGSVNLMDVGLMQKLELSGQGYRVLHAVMAAVPEKGGSVAFITQAEIAERLNIHQPSVARVMKELQERRLIFKVPGRTGRWRVNAWLAYSGDFDSWNAEAEEDPEPIWVRGVDATTGEVR